MSETHTSIAQQQEQLSMIGIHKTRVMSIAMMLILVMVSLSTWNLVSAHHECNAPPLPQDLSSLGMLVGFRELSGETQFFASRTFRIFEYFAVTAVICYVIVKLILLASRLLATRLFKY